MQLVTGNASLQASGKVILRTVNLWVKPRGRAFAGLRQLAAELQESVDLGVHA